MLFCLLPNSLSLLDALFEIEKRCGLPVGSGKGEETQTPGPFRGSFGARQTSSLKTKLPWLFFTSTASALSIYLSIDKST